MKKKEITLEIIAKKLDGLENHLEKKIDNLTIEMRKGFTEVDEWFGKMYTHFDERLNETNRRIDSIEIQMATKSDLQKFRTQINERFDTLEENYNHRIPLLETRVEKVKKVLEKDLKIKLPTSF